MCDCYEGEYEELELSVEQSEPAPQIVPLLVVRKRK